VTTTYTEVTKTCWLWKRKVSSFT